MVQKSLPSLVKFPWPWPPSNPVVLQAFDTPYFALRVYGLVDGHIKILIKYPDGRQWDVEYQKVSTPSAGLVIMVVVIDGDKVTLYLNGALLLLRQDAKGKAKHVNVSEVPAEPALHLDLPDEQAVHDKNEWLFIRSLGDLAHKISTGDKYEILQATLPLRKLLLEGQPLMTIVNRQYRKKLRFKILPFVHDLLPQSEMFWQTIDPSLIPQATTVDVDLKDLLRTTCLTIGDVSYSVRDIVNACAYAKGGIHIGQPETQKERDLVKLDKDYKLFGQESSVAAMVGIVTVVLKGLEPLVDCIKDRLKNA